MKDINMKFLAMYAASAILQCAFFAQAAQAAVQTFVNFDQWQAAAGEITTIDFTDLPYFTPVTEQYASMGVHFPDGDDFIYGASFSLDNYGLSDFGKEQITILFDMPQNWIGIHHPGFVQIEYYFGDRFLFRDTFTGSGGTGFFHGVVSDQYFDKVIVLDPLSKTVDIDNLYFGPVPTPGVLPLLIGLLAIRRRRRC